MAVADNIELFGNNIIVAIETGQPIIPTQPTSAAYGQVRYLGDSCSIVSAGNNVLFNNQNARYFSDGGGANLCTLSEDDVYFKYVTPP